MADQRKRQFDDPPWRTLLIHGLIVLDGLLAVAASGEHGFEVTSADHVLLRSDNLPPPSGLGDTYQHEAVIDVVHASAMPEYVRTLQGDLRALTDHVREIRAAGRVHESFRDQRPESDA